MRTVLDRAYTDDMVHDWTRVEAGIFHAFHTTWIPVLSAALNHGVLPDGFYSLPEQHAGESIADLLALHASADSGATGLPYLPVEGGTLLADAPPRVRHRRVIETNLLARQRSVAIRHVSGHRLVAVIEIVSPANKDRPGRVAEFAEKARSMLEHGVSLLLVDVFPPGRHDPDGLHGAIQRALEDTARRYEWPAQEPLTLASYTPWPLVEAFIEHLAVGAALPEMPLFLGRDRYVEVPLERTYSEAWEALPAFWRQVVAARA